MPEINYQFFPSTKKIFSPYTVSFSDLKADCHNIEKLCFLLISPPFRFLPLSNFNAFSFLVLSVTPFLFLTFLRLSLNLNHSVFQVDIAHENYTKSRKVSKQDFDRVKKYSYTFFLKKMFRITGNVSLLPSTVLCCLCVRFPFYKTQDSIFS